MVTPGASEIIETILKSDEPSLHSISSQLPEDLQQTIFQLYSQDVLLSDLDKLDIKKEWQHTFKQLQTEASHLRITQITSELEALDSEVDKTPEILEKQEKLLRELVQLKR